MYDLGIMTSIFLLSTIYAIALSIVGYTTLTNKLFRCTDWILIPKFITNYFKCVWNISLNRKRADVFLSIIVLALAIIPMSLVWPITYPIMAYLFVKYQFSDLSSSV